MAILNLRQVSGDFQVSGDGTKLTGPFFFILTILMIDALGVAIVFPIITL